MPSNRVPDLPVITSGRRLADGLLLVADDSDVAVTVSEAFIRRVLDLPTVTT